MSEYYPQFLSSMSGVTATQQQQHQPQQQQQQQQLPQPPQQQLYLSIQQPLQQQQQQQTPFQQNDIPLPPLPPLPPQQELLQQQLQEQLQQQQQQQIQFGQFQTLRYFPGYGDTVLLNVAAVQRPRRKSTAANGSDHVKHRRTRSGCYTCRHRRIKCDEARPICDRCKKGKRDCSYPKPKSPKKSASSSSREPSTASQHASPNSSDEDDDAHDDGADYPPYAPYAPNESYQSHTLSQINQNYQGYQQQRQPGPIPDDQAAAAAAAAAATAPPFSFASPAGTVSFPSTPSGTASSNFFPAAAAAAAKTGPGGHYPFPTFASPPLSLLSRSPSSARLLPASPPPLDVGHLPADLQFLLGYFCENITHLHYCLPSDADNFVRGLLPALALQCEPLLFALVAFAAYHCVLRAPGGRLQQFLHYYNQSVRLLLGVLRRKEPHRLGTLLAVLQLATIEEHLGDWVNLMGHQRAALEMLTDIFTPSTVLQTPAGRMALHWYARFDVFVGLMGGFETALARTWFDAAVAYYEAAAARDPTNLRMRVEACSARLRRICMEMSLLFARPRDELAASDAAAGPTEPFSREHARLLAALQEWKAGLDAVVAVDDEEHDDGNDDGEEDAINEKYDDDNYEDGGNRYHRHRRQQPRPHHLLVTDFSHAKPLGDDDIVNPYEPGILYYEPLFSVTILTCEWQSIIAMHELQAAQLAKRSGSSGAGPAKGGRKGKGWPSSASPVSTTSSPPDSFSSPSSSPAPSAPLASEVPTSPVEPAVMAALTQRAYAICRIVETLERWPASPPGCLIMTQAMLAIAALFLPRDHRHHTWIRHKFARIESMGYIFPLTMRTRMAELLNDPSCVHWWLPGDEGFSPILRSIRAFADERNATAVSAQKENLREIRHVFSKMQLGGGR